MNTLFSLNTAPDKQIIRAVYGQLRSTSNFGKYKNILEELELLGISSTSKKIETLHSIILQTKSLKEALDLVDNLSDSEKTKLISKAKSIVKEKEKEKKEKAKKAKAIKLQKKLI